MDHALHLLEKACAIVSDVIVGLVFATVVIVVVLANTTNIFYGW